MRAVAVLSLVVACGDNSERTCTPEPGALPSTGPFIDPYALPLENCVEGGLRELPARCFLVDPTQYFRLEYPMYEGTCSTGFRRAFARADDHDLSDGFSFYTWSDGTRYFQRSETHYGTTVFVRASVACLQSNDTL